MYATEIGARIYRSRRAVLPMASAFDAYRVGVPVWVKKPRGMIMNRLASCEMTPTGKSSEGDMWILRLRPEP